MQKHYGTIKIVSVSIDAFCNCYIWVIKRNLTIADTQPLPEFQETIVKDPDSLILQNGRGAIFSSNNRLMVALRKKKGNSGFRLYDLKAK